MEWHVGMFDWTLRLCGRAGSGLPALQSAAWWAGSGAWAWAWCCAPCPTWWQDSTFWTCILASSIQQLFKTFQELNDSCCLARKKNRQLEGIKNNSKKNLFSNQLLLTGGFEGGKEEDEMERSQPHACPSVQRLGMGIRYTTSWMWDQESTSPYKRRYN